MPGKLSDDATVLCHACGHARRLAWLVARALFRQTGDRLYECGPQDCPRCNARVAAYLGAVGADAGEGIAPSVLVNVPADDRRSRG